MATWQIIRGSTTLNLSDRNPFDVVSVQGVGIPPIRRLTERGPFQDGESDLGFRLDARTINMVVVSKSATLADADSARAALWNYVKPLSTPIILKCTRDDGVERQIEAYPTGMIDAPVMDGERIGTFQRYAVQLRAPFPAWHDPEMGYYTAIGGASTGSYGFTIPLTIAWTMVSSSSIDADLTVPYQGTWSVFPKLTVYGPVSGCTITNTTTDEVLDFPSLVLDTGEWIEIDLAYGAKTIVDDLGTNRISELSSDSDLATWHFAADPDAPDGDNVINFAVAAAATDDTGIKIEYAQHYIGL